MTDLQQLSDEGLACRVQAGSLACFEELVYRYEKRVFNFLRLKVAQPQDAKDLTQRTFIAAYRAIDKYKPKYRFVTWLFTIARRQAISHYRSHRPTEQLVADPVDMRTPDVALGGSDEAGRLWTLARGALPENQVAVLWLHYAEDLSVKEIAATMKKTVSHVKVLMHRGRKRLGDVLRESPLERTPPPIPTEGVNHVPS